MNIDYRNAVRNTWASRNSLFLKRGSAKIYFLLGTVEAEGVDKWIFEESKKYQDIIQVNIMDTVSNLVHKSLSGLNLKKNYCKLAPFYIKMDDDVLLNFPKLETIINDIKMSRWGILGALNKRDKVKRRYSRSVSKKNYPFTYYPLYESGACYVITTDLIKPLIDAASKKKKIKTEDVFITGILGRILKVRHYHNGGFSFWKTPVPENECEFVKNKVSVTNFENPNAMIKFWRIANLC